MTTYLFGTIGTVETDIALQNEDPIGFVLSETRAFIDGREPVSLQPGKVVVVRVDVVTADEAKALLA